MKNKLTDLNNLLFEQLERLNDDDLTGQALEEQLKKSIAMVKVSGTIIQGAAQQLEAVKVMDDLGYIRHDTQGIIEQLGFNNE